MAGHADRIPLGRDGTCTEDDSILGKALTVSNTYNTTKAYVLSNASSLVTLERLVVSSHPPRVT